MEDVGAAYLSCFWREELEGEGWLPFGLCLGEFLRDVHVDVYVQE